VVVNFGNGLVFKESLREGPRTAEAFHSIPAIAPWQGLAGVPALSYNKLREAFAMPERKRVVTPVEVTYVCDACGQGMMEQSGAMDPDSGDIEHQCLICDHQQIFKWKHYPRVDHIDDD
jgi:hypothetical protein